MTRTSFGTYSWILCCFWVFGLAGLYIFQVNMLAQTAFSLGAGEGQVKTLQTRIKALEAVTKQTRSAELATLAQGLQFEKIQTISYVRLMRQAVAQNIAR